MAKNIKSNNKYTAEELSMMIDNEKLMRKKWKDEHIECKTFIYNAVDFVQNYLHKNKLKAMVLGISGGLDSTVVAAICNIVNKNTGIPLIGVMLPSNTNAIKENSSAHATCKAFCNNIIDMNIDDMYGLMQYKCNQIGDKTTVSDGNLKARLRMTVLYHIAGINNGVVMDTDNMTENQLGFFTVHGDQGDLSPIYPLWKHEVYDVAKYILYDAQDKYYLSDLYDMTSLNIEIAMEKALELTPTDGNGVTAGGDMDQIAPGSNYDEVDYILKELISSNYDDDIIENLRKKYGDTFERVYSRHLSTSFKRKNLPVRITREQIEK